MVHIILPLVYFGFETIIVAHFIIKLTRILRDRIDSRHPIYTQPAAIITILLSFAAISYILWQLFCLEIAQSETHAKILEIVYFIFVARIFYIVISDEDGEDSNILNPSLICVYLLSRFWGLA